MTKIEIKFFNFIKKHLLFISFIFITLLGLVLRYFGLGFKSGDFNVFLNLWWSQIEKSGLEVLAKQIGNYNIPYQIIIFILTRLPIDALLGYKMLSVCFDVVLSLSSALLVFELTGRKKKFLALITYMITFCSLTVVLNSAFWAQCDSIYVSFIILAIYFLIKDKTIPSYIMLGVALAFKLQVIFILPFFFFYYVLTRKTSILHFLIIPAVDIIMCLPALLFGRNPMDIFNVYHDQTNNVTQMYLNIPNFYAFMCDYNDANMYSLLKIFSIFLTLTVLSIVLILMIHKGTDLTNRRMLIMTAVWTVFTTLMLLSSMHERYGYLLDILVIIYAIVYKKNIWVAVVCNLVSLRGYCYYLFNLYQVLDLKWASLFYIATYVYVTFTFIKDILSESNSKKINKTEKMIEA